MSDDPRPGYDYFAPPPAAGLPPTRPPQAGAPHAGPPHARQSPGRAPHARPSPQSQPSYPIALWGMPRWVNVLFAVIGVLLAGGLATVVAIPMVARHQLNAQFSATRITVPATFNGQSRKQVDQADAALSAAGPGFARTELGLYGESTLNLVLILAARPVKALDERAQELARAEFTRNFAKTSNGAQLALTRVSNPGKLGGWLGCGPVSGVTVCVATDSGSMVAVLMGPATPDPRELARIAREATVTRS